MYLYFVLEAGTVIQACNPSCAGSGDWEGHSSGPLIAKKGSKEDEHGANTVYTCVQMQN
jgi:hypothetical protein